jgi:hypothetical protein
MSTYNHNRATPGNKANLRLFLQKSYLNQYYSAFNTSQITENILNGYSYDIESFSYTKSYILDILVLIITCFNLEEEIKEAYSDFQNYITDKWNYIELTSIISSTIYVLLDLY